MSLSLVIFAAITVHRSAHAAQHHVAAASTQSDQSAVLGGALIWIAAIVGTYFLAKWKRRKPNGWVFAAVVAIPICWLVPIILACFPRGTYIKENFRKIASEQREQANSKLADIVAGRLAPFIPNGVMPLEAEQFYWEQRSQYGQTVAQRAYKGTNPALYIPLGHGLRMRVGGYSGGSQNISNFQWLSAGTVYISNRRVVFKADNGEVAIAPFSEIITYDAFPDGLSVNVNKIGMMQWRTGDDCLGAVFLRMVKGPPKDELTVSKTTS